MNVEQARYHLNSLKNRSILLRLTETILVSVGIAMLVYGLSGLLIFSLTVRLALAIVLGFAVFGIRVFQQNLLQYSQKHIIQFVNIHYPALQESADLLLVENENLTNLQLLQKEIVLQQFDRVYPTIKIPHHIKQAFGIFVGCSLAYLALSGFTITEKDKTSNKEITAQQSIKPVSEDPKAIFIESLSPKVTPPSYTGLPSFVSKTFSLNVPEGSLVHWTANFSDQPKDAKIIFSGRDSVQLKPTHENTFYADRTINTTGFYQVQWRDPFDTYRSDYYKIDMIKDQPPKIVVNDLEQFTELRYNDKLVIDVKSTLNDDYGLADAQIVATVSKGSGEGIKFREEKIRFSKPQHISGKQISAETSLNLHKLGLEPGDELYFYVEATDNKTPVANRNRTETFFISLKDTASYALVADDGLGVDLMPEYFRSQRQIIIDTEKLLKQQKEKKVTKQQFNFTSNELGYDQKVLRLRYGQFLGEEADSGIPHGTEPEGEEHTDEDEDKEKDPTKIFTHEHDTKNEHNLVADKRAGGHNHEETIPGEEEKEQDPLKAFVHEHDNQEEATFFMVSVRTKLKMALSIMWDAELHLRLYDPAKSLPYQYKALNLLKEISNDSRIYVHRMGFDPPPLKEEKRLTGDLSEIKTSTNKYAVVDERKLQGIQEALTLLEKLLLQSEPVISVAHKKILTAAGEELAVIALEEPGVSLKGLSLIKDLTDGNIDSEKLKPSLSALQEELWDILPPAPASAKKQSGTAHELDRKFLQQLEDRKHD